MRNRLVFAYESARDDDDLIEDAKDFLDASAEGEWEVISWATNQGIVVMVNAPLECRTMHLEPALEMEFIPLSAAMDEMSDRDNEWIEPEPTDDQSSLGQAQEMVHRWMNGMFDDSNIPDEPEPTPPPEEKPKTRGGRKRRQSRSEAPVSKERRAPAEDIPTGRNPDKRGVKKRASLEDRPTPKMVDDDHPVELENPKAEPEKERHAAPAEQRGGADDLMAKFGLKGTLKGSEAFGEMFVFKDEGDSQQG